jgi:hypothetical protein
MLDGRANLLTSGLFLEEILLILETIDILLATAAKLVLERALVEPKRLLLEVADGSGYSSSEPQSMHLASSSACSRPRSIIFPSAFMVFYR